MCGQGCAHGRGVLAGHVGVGQTHGSQLGQSTNKVRQGRHTNGAQLFAAQGVRKARGGKASSALYMPIASGMLGVQAKREHVGWGYTVIGWAGTTRIVVPVVLVPQSQHTTPHAPHMMMLCVTNRMMWQVGAGRGHRTAYTQM